VSLAAVSHIEECRIPLDVPLPEPGWPIRFGAAAGMVHPVTGFLLSRILRQAPALARSLACSEQPELAAHAALWPGSSQLQARLYRYAVGVVASLGAEDTRAFFRALFSQPEDFVWGYLSDTLSVTELARGMLSLLGSLPSSLQERLAPTGDLRALYAALRAQGLAA
jgi:lycopene beta-cyclase